MSRITATILLSAAAFLLWAQTASAQVVISEIMYDPKGTDANAGGEWIEIQNNDSAAIDLTKWFFFEADTNHSITADGAAEIPPGGYAVISRDVDVFKKYFTDFSGKLFKSSFSLKNDGESIAMKSGNKPTDPIIDSVTYSSEQGAKDDGNSLQKINGSWISASPTPGRANEASNSGSAPANTSSDATASSGVAETTVATPATAETAGSNLWPVEPQMFARIKNPPKVAMVGADALFQGEALGLKKEPLDGARYLWTFGDGGTKEGESVLYHYNYPGKYVVILNASSGKYGASARVTIEAIPADVIISSVGTAGDSFVEVYNKTKYELDFSGWRLRAGAKLFTIPKDTIILPGAKIMFPSQYTGFVSIGGGDVALLYPNGTVVNAYSQTPVQTSGAQVVVNQVAEPKREFPPETATDGKAVAEIIVERDIEETAGVQQSANVFTAAADTGNDLYKWFLGVVLLAATAIVGLFFTQSVAQQNIARAEADDYEIVEEK